MLTKERVAELLVRIDKRIHIANTRRGELAIAINNARRGRSTDRCGDISIDTVYAAADVTEFERQLASWEKSAWDWAEIRDLTIESGPRTCTASLRARDRMDWGTPRTCGRDAGEWCRVYHPRQMTLEDERKYKELRVKIKALYRREKALIAAAYERGAAVDIVAANKIAIAREGK